ncbi:MAG: hypothetical protein ISS55_11200 [Dehalococcoidales bacterium]|nr:hypothetical protein [Dehalococcoidales bacterium]
MKRTDLAYIAGIVDGEGYIGITADGKKFKHGRQNLRLRVTVTNTSEWLCQYLKFRFGGGKILLRTLSPNHRPCWQWQVDYQKAGDFLKLILPYLHLKKPQAELAIKFQEAKGRSTRALDEKKRAVEEAQRILMQNMKRS